MSERKFPGEKTRDVGAIDNMQFNEAAGSKKVSEVGTHLLPIPFEFDGDILYTTDISSSVGEQTIETEPDVDSSLNDTYFLLESQSGNKYAIWFNVDNTGTPPVVPDYTSVEVAISENDNAAVVGGAMAAVIAALNSGNDFSTAGTSTVTVTNLTAGVFNPATDFSTGFTFTTLEPGSGGPLPLPKKGACLAVYNKDTSLHSVTLGEDESTVPLAPGETDSEGHVGIPCVPGFWTYIACGEQNWVITDSADLLVFLVDDNTFIK